MVPLAATDFADMLEQDIDSHNNKLGDKYHFNFANEEPAQLNSLSNSMGPLKKEDSAEAVKPVRLIEPKKRMTLKVKDVRFSIPSDPRPSLFGSSVKTESTNITSSSNVTMGANGDFTFCQSFGRRTSIQFGFKSSTVVAIPEFKASAGQQLDEEFKVSEEE